jgi:hypothetical protein
LFGGRNGIFGPGKVKEKRKKKDEGKERRHWECLQSKL